MLVVSVAWKLHATEQTRLRGQRCVDGVEALEFRIAARATDAYGRGARASTELPPQAHFINAERHRGTGRNGAPARRKLQGLGQTDERRDVVDLGRGV